MSNTLVPKEQLSAYQRWEMTSFGDERPSSVAKRAAAAASPSVPMAPMVTAEEAERIRHNAAQEGYAAGHEAGLAQGQDQGYENGMALGYSEGHAQALAEGRAEAARETAWLRQVAENFGTAVTHANELVAQDVLDLALDLGKAILKTALAARPELLLPVVRDAIDYLPNLQQPALLHLDPEDLLLVREHIGEELAKAGWRLVEDPNIGRGGCRVETGSNQVDAAIAGRWQRLAASLGRDLDWLAP